MKPNYLCMGLACNMGPVLRKEIERQLLLDLEYYKVSSSNIKFDWSESCIEGRCASYLDGSFDRYSGIQMFDDNDDYVGEGWMDFIFEEEGEIFIVYWQFLDVMVNEKMVTKKEKVGIPEHIFNRLPEQYKMRYARNRVI